MMGLCRWPKARLYIPKEDTTSPTVHEHTDMATTDIQGAFHAG